MKKNEDKNKYFDWRLLALLAVVIIVGAGAAVFLFSLGQNYGRMNNDEAVNIYQMKMPEGVKEAISREGVSVVSTVNDSDVPSNPLLLSGDNISLGSTYYGYYCIQCHGRYADGKGTVGQSFYPLPTDLSDPYVQEQTDSQLFKKISLGFNRHPPLAYTVSEHERWAIIIYIRSLRAPVNQ